MMEVAVIIVLLYKAVTGVLGSAGDRSWIFQKCLQSCLQVNCTSRHGNVFESTQPQYMRLLQWDCPSECEYLCMWKTVDAYQRDGSPVPQFHGKWPFTRLFGIQEPASMIFSILNGLSHIVMMRQFRSKVPSSAPLYYLVHIYCLVGINAWMWSTIFHTRDLPFTEKMDYFCAIMLVLMNLYYLLFRLLGYRSLLQWLSYTVPVIAFYVYHVCYLTFVKFDYGYNMKANITLGGLNSVGWFAWCVYHRQKLKYVWKCFLVVLITDLLLSLELGDFPAIWWTFDAHSLWHCGTAPLALLWYSFSIDDCLHLHKEVEIHLD